MKTIREEIGGVGNLMFKQAYLAKLVWEGKIPDVYVQDFHLWEHWQDGVKNLFSRGIGPKTDYVSLHIRRGDYLKAKHFHVDLSETNYYQKAVALFPDDEFLVFCKDTQDKVQDIEDREWCTAFLNSFIPGRWKFAPIGNSETEDMNEMASCKSNIIANSTFSWWAAFLNPNPDKNVIAPKSWFVSQPGIPYPSDWIQL